MVHRGRSVSRGRSGRGGGGGGDLRTGRGPGGCPGGSPRGTAERASPRRKCLLELNTNKTDD